MEIIILLGLFALNACVLYYTALKRYSIVIVLNIACLCLVVALAGMLMLLENILWILLAILTGVFIFFIGRWYKKRQKVGKIEHHEVIDVEMEEISHEDI